MQFLLLILLWLRVNLVKLLLETICLIVKMTKKNLAIKKCFMNKSRLVKVGQRFEARVHTNKESRC